MQASTRNRGDSAVGLAKLVALALVLALLFSTGRVLIAVLFDPTQDAMAFKAEIGQIADRNDTRRQVSGAILAAPDPH